MSQHHALLVDDNLKNLRVLALLLARQGISTTQVSDPLDLTELLPALGPVDVVFLDLEMPGLSGFEAKALIRQHLASTPIIAYTVHSHQVGLVRQSGFDGFLSKPLDSARFPDQITRILNGQPVWERA